MDYVQENFNALTSAVSSVIRREVDCLTDEIISSEQKYYCSDLNLSDIIRPFMQHHEVLEIENRIDVGEINSSDVLICVSFECKSERLDEIVQYFKENNAKIVLISESKSISRILSNFRVLPFKSSSFVKSFTSIRLPKSLNPTIALAFEVFFVRILVLPNTR